MNTYFFSFIFAINLSLYFLPAICNQKTGNKIRKFDYYTIKNSFQEALNKRNCYMEILNKKIAKNDLKRELEEAQELFNDPFLTLLQFDFDAIYSYCQSVLFSDSVSVPLKVVALYDLARIHFAGFGVERNINSALSYLKDAYDMCKKCDHEDDIEKIQVLTRKVWYKIRVFMRSVFERDIYLYDLKKSDLSISEKEAIGVIAKNMLDDPELNLSEKKEIEHFLSISLKNNLFLFKHPV